MKKKSWTNAVSFETNTVREAESEQKVREWTARALFGMNKLILEVSKEKKDWKVFLGAKQH